VAELDFIAALRELAVNPAARELLDDAAVLDFGTKRLVLTHDILVEGVHFLPSDPPATVAWKLLAVNLSDLAAKGARPIGVLMGYSLTGQESWDAAFVTELGAALKHFNVPLLGGDTVSAKERMLSLTAIGEAIGSVPSRSGAREGDALFVTGVIGDAGQGLKLLKECRLESHELINAYRQPEPQIAAGAVLAPQVTAMMDVSDGLLLDASRLAGASDCAALIDLDAIPLSDAFRRVAGDDLQARLAAATAGDDYQLLFTSSLPLPSLACPVTRIGKMVRGSGVQLMSENRPVPLPETLGWLHA
jgi:thiamine-monophosphate kinase